MSHFLAAHLPLNLPRAAAAAVAHFMHNIHPLHEIQILFSKFGVSSWQEAQDSSPLVISIDIYVTPRQSQVLALDGSWFCLLLMGRDLTSTPSADSCRVISVVVILLLTRCRLSLSNFILWKQKEVRQSCPKAELRPKIHKHPRRSYRLLLGHEMHQSPTQGCKSNKGLGDTSYCDMFLHNEYLDILKSCE